MRVLRRSSATLSLLVVTSLLGLGATRCSSSSSSSNPAGDGGAGASAAGTFRGVVVGPDDLSGVLELTSTAPGSAATQTLRPLDVTASTYALAGTLQLNVPGLGPVAITGTLDLASNTATFSGAALGGTVTFRGTYAAGTLRGTATLPNGAEAPFTLSNASLGVKTYCGSFTGGRSGRWSMLAAGSQIGAVFVAGDRTVGRGLGTIDASNLVNVTLEPSGSAVGNLSAGSIDGTWDHAGARGAFAASESACNALTPQGTLPDGGVLDGGATSDGGSSTPGAPEDLHTTAGAVAIQYLAIDGAKLFFSLDHTYFSQTVTLRSVGTDGTGAADVVPTTTAAVVGGLTAAGGRVYWIAGTDPPSNDANLFSVAATGGATTDHGVIGRASSRDDMAVPHLVSDGANVFATWDGSSTDGIRSYSLAGAAGTAVTDLVGPKAIGLDGTDLWLGDFEGLRKGSKSLSPAPAVVVPRADYGNFAYVVDIAFDAANVYFATNTSSASALWRRPKAGGAIEPVIASTPGRFRGLAVLGDQIYFVNGSSSGGQQGGASASLVRVPKAATNAQPITVGPANLAPVVTDGTWVYWGNGTKIQRLHK